MSVGNISRDECLILNEVLDRTETPIGCYSLTHNSGDDKFTYSHNEQIFQGEDASRHRNSWLMPKMARRLTKNSQFHVSKWRKPVEIDAKECDVLRQTLEQKMGAKEAGKKLPKVCKK